MLERSPDLIADFVNSRRTRSLDILSPNTGTRFWPSHRSRGEEPPFEHVHILTGAPPIAIQPVLSVVIPTFNEIDRIEPTLRSASEYLQRVGAPYEIIVIDNDSSDGTAGLVRDLMDRGLGSITLVVEPCRGKGAAVKRGVLQTRGQFVVFMDADNATPLSEFARFWPLLASEFDVVIGSRYLDSSRVLVPQAFTRIMLSRIGNAFIRLLLIPEVRDTQLGFKGFRGEVARDLFGRLVTERWVFDVELLVMARRCGYRIREVGVAWREHGGSHINWTAYLASLADVLRIRWRAWRGAYARPPA